MVALLPAEFEQLANLSTKGRQMVEFLAQVSRPGAKQAPVGVFQQAWNDARTIITKVPDAVFEALVVDEYYGPKTAGALAQLVPSGVPAPPTRAYQLSTWYAQNHSAIAAMGQYTPPPDPIPAPMTAAPVPSVPLEEAYAPVALQPMQPSAATTEPVLAPAAPVPVAAQGPCAPYRDTAPNYYAYCYAEHADNRQPLQYEAWLAATAPVPATAVIEQPQAPLIETPLPTTPPEFTPREYVEPPQLANQAIVISPSAPALLPEAPVVVLPPHEIIGKTPGLNIPIIAAGVGAVALGAGILFMLSRRAEAA